MQARAERWSAVTGLLAVVLWVLGIVVTNAMSHKIPSHPTDAQLLVWVKGSANTIILGGRLFMLGCVSFIWFAGMLAARGSRRRRAARRRSRRSRSEAR